MKKDGIVDTAKNGEEGFHKAANTFYAVIISDIDMPKMNGIEFFQRLEEKYSDVGRRFIFISGDPTDESITYIKRKNIQFLSKPFKLQEIQKRVFNVMEKIVV